MKKRFRLTIRKKVFLLTAALSVALILISVSIATAVFNSRVKKEARDLCESTVDVLSEYLETYDLQVSGSGETVPFVSYYMDKLKPIYLENRDEIERMSKIKPTTDEEFAEKKEYFTSLTAHLFGEGVGFGMSYDILSFKSAYAEVIEEMERLSTFDGVMYCETFFYDAERENFVWMCDSTSEKDWVHVFPCGVTKASEGFLEEVLRKDGVTVISSDEEFASYAPVKVDGKIAAYVALDYSIERLVDSQRAFMRTLILIMLAATAVILIFYLILSDRWLVKNVTKLSDAARKFTSHMDGDEIRPVSADIKTRDEIGDLSDDFFALQNKVIVYSDDIARKRAEEERMQAELNIASKIQMQSLPDRPLSVGDGCVSSFIKPAKEVGGDLFDYFVTDESKLFFVIADVSGKGVPAALFMMRGKEIIRSCAKAGMSAGKIAATANAELCLNNKEGLFITAFIGIYDDKAKTLTYARAGHEQPFLLRDGKAEKFGEESNFVLGLFDGMPFAEDSLGVREGDSILLYTDGLNEGINEKNEQFGYERIRETLESEKSDILPALFEKASEFAGDAEQFDDITMVLFECVKNASFSLGSPTFSDIPAVTDKINGFIAGYDKDKTAELDVIIDEIMNNCISYAFEGVKKPRLDIDVRLSRGVARLTFTDNGMLFDPLKAEKPDGDTADDRVGGWGIMITKTISDSISYRVFEGQNRLTVTKDLRKQI